MFLPSHSPSYNEWMPSTHNLSLTLSLSLSVSIALGIAIWYLWSRCEFNQHASNNQHSKRELYWTDSHIHSTSGTKNQTKNRFISLRFFFFSSSLALCEHVIFARFFSSFLSFLLSQFMLFDFYCDEMQISIGRIDRYYSQLEMKLRH